MDYFQLKPSPLYRGARINLLNAPVRAVTINGGQQMNSWYDITTLSKSIDDTKRTNKSEIEESLSILDRKIVE
jgi:predicted esterase